MSIRPKDATNRPSFSSTERKSAHAWDRIHDTTCIGTSCAGKKYNAQGCDYDTRPLAGRDNATTIIEVMYSDTCQAAWAKAKGAPPRSVIKITDPNGPLQLAGVKAATGKSGPRPTPMLFAPVGTRLTACIITDSQQICTETIEVGAS